jgi:hypothetical protein
MSRFDRDIGSPKGNQSSLKNLDDIIVEEPKP